nr:Chain A, Transportan in bicellar solution with [DMPC]/[DHPC]=0.33 [synthetic construct]
GWTLNSAGYLLGKINLKALAALAKKIL